MSKIRIMVVFIAMMMAAGSLFSFPNEAYACSCAFNESVKEERERNDAVFEGTAIAVKQPFSPFSRSSASKVKTTFEVNEVWKGKVARTIEVTSAQSGASCGFEFLEGQRYLVYARTTGDSLDVSLCSRTALYSAAGQDIVELGELGSSSIPPEPAPASNTNVQMGWIIGAVFLLFIGVSAWAIVNQRRNRVKSKI